MAETLAPLRDEIPDLKTGQQIRVHQTIREGEKERTQIFEGVLIKRSGGKSASGTITVRKIGAGQVGVEKIFPLHSPLVTKIEIVGQGKTRRANLAYLRDPRATQLKIKPIEAEVKKK